MSSVFDDNSASGDFFDLFFDFSADLMSAPLSGELADGQEVWQGKGDESLSATIDRRVRGPFSIAI